MHIYRPRSARVTAVAIVGVAALVAAARIAGDGLRAAAPAVGLAALVAIAGYLAYWRPSIGVGPDAIAVRNVFRRTTVPLGHIVHVDTKWALELYLDDGRKLTAFAAPAPGAFAARTMRADDARGLPRGSYLDGTVRPGDRRGTPSGDAAVLVRTALATHRKGDADAAAGPVAHQDDRFAVIALGVGLAAAVAGFLI